MSIFQTVQLKDFSNYKTGGVCRYFCRPTKENQIISALTILNKKNIPFYILGAGTNSLILDNEWTGGVFALDQLRSLRLIDEFTIYCEAGVTNTELSNFAQEHGLTGLEWMHGLPGQVGGSVRMNARCYGGETSQVITKVNSIDRNGKYKTRTIYPDNTNIFKGYKNTIFMTNKEIISSVEIKLKPGNKLSSLAKMNNIILDRETKGHFAYPNCGCVFKNDYSKEVSVPSGLLLEHSNVKNLRVGGATVSAKHANFIYNKDNATSDDIILCSLEMRERVWDNFSVWLEYEMEILGTPSKKIKDKISEKRRQSPKKEKILALRNLIDSQKNKKTKNNAQKNL
ncbi:MAG: UDP-N-acetylenolpyruvoylglucosamine reductase [Zetaproteobacteria bacterium]|nr:UDP-N-acetylenolpyruvoylglucosamine reductase [Pseudobdellovibrionaceae bacterium]